MKKEKRLTIQILWLIAIFLLTACSMKNAIAPLDSTKSPLEPTQGMLVQEGTASVYADKFHGRETASGETFNQNELTAASKTLPLGSEVEVINKKTGKKTKVKINDRGPFVKGRVIDLSKAAAKEIEMPTDGLGEVLIRKAN